MDGAHGTDAADGSNPRLVCPRPSSAERGEQLTAQGGEWVVVKPLDVVAEGRRGRLQRAVTGRGREELRLISGPKYTAPAHLTRIVCGEPLRRMHECVFGVLALETEAVDPRL